MVWSIFQNIPHPSQKTLIPRYYLKIFFLSVPGVKCINKTTEGRLIADLFLDYDAAVKPAVDENEALLINISMSFLQLIGLVSSNRKPLYVVILLSRIYMFQVKAASPQAYGW